MTASNVLISLTVHWLRLHASNEGGMGLIRGQGTKIPHAVWPKERQVMFYDFCSSLVCCS